MCQEVFQKYPCFTCQEFRECLLLINKERFHFHNLSECDGGTSQVNHADGWKSDPPVGASPHLGPEDSHRCWRIYWPTIMSQGETVTPRPFFCHCVCKC